VVDHGAAPFRGTCDHPVICTPSINCTPRRAVFLTELCKRRISACLRVAHGEAALVGGTSLLVLTERPTSPDGDDRFHGKQQRARAIASSVRTARLHGGCCEKDAESTVAGV
jgi:hypothetical protein